jgi:hypothetical protein
LTFSSIDAILNQLEQDKAIKRFLPVMDADQKDVRDLFMLPPLHDWLYQSDRKKTRDYKANIRGFLRRYVIGLRVDNTTYMKSWRSGVFELRVQLEPRRENTRIFGAFVKLDTFLAVHPPKLRSDFGSKGDPRWDVAIDRVLATFAGLFPDHFPVPAHPFSGCVSTNWYDARLNLGG